MRWRPLHPKASWELLKLLKRHAGQLEGVPLIRDATPYSSEKHNLAQLIDMVCGAAARHFKYEGDRAERYRQIVVDKELLIQIFPQPEQAD